MAELWESLAQLRYVLRADLWRYKGRTGLGGGLRAYRRIPGYCFTFWLRVASYLRPRPALRPFYWVAEMMRHRYEIKYGIVISSDTQIGPGLYIGHFGGIVVNSEARIGRNCNLAHGVTIGKTPRGKRKGCPTIGDCVYIGPGAKIIGKVTVGSNAAIGANAVVVTDVENGAVMVGIPAREVSRNGSEGYVIWTDYDCEE